MHRRSEPRPSSLPKPSRSARQFDALRQRFRRPELQLDAAGLLLGQEAELVELHRRRDRGAERNRVHALLVADEVHVGQRFQIVDAGVGAERPGRLVLEAAGRMPVLRLVLDGEVLLVDLRDAPAGDRAPKAGLVGEQVRLTVGLARLGHGLRRDRVCALELHLTVVAGRHGAGLVDDVHEDLRAVGRQTLPGDGVLLQHLLARGRRLQELAAVLDLDAARAAHGDGLQVL